MKFVLREYLSSLKEDGELDTFILELSRAMNLIPLSITQRGRQDGVDLCAIGEDEDKVRKVFMFVIKKGNFSRTTWNSGNINDIMPTLDEVRLVYINTRVPDRFKELKKKIIVSCNGYLEQTVDGYWSQYTRQYSNENLEYDFWGIDKLVELAEIRQMNELILSPDIAMQFRRALSFIDLPDYNLSHYYNFLDSILPLSDSSIRGREAIKKIRLLRLCMVITNLWCEKSGNLKPAYIASERVLLNTWGWIVRNELAGNRHILPEYYRIAHTWQQFAHKYVLKVWDFFSVPDGLALGVGEHNEYCLLTYEQIGIISCIGHYQLWDAHFRFYSSDPDIISLANESMVIAEKIADSLALLIHSNSSAYNPRFDEHCIEINMGLSLLYHTGKFQTASQWLKSVIEYLGMNYQMMKFFPLFTTDYSKLGEPISEEKSSILITLLAEWCLVLKQPLLYQGLRNIILQNFPDVNLQLWFPDAKIDDKLFWYDASHDFGSVLLGLKLHENIKEFEMWIAEERQKFNTESDSSIYQFGLDFLLPVANRHFRTYPFPNSWRRLIPFSFCFSSIAMSDDRTSE